jgi:hypothetical protein
MLQSNQITQDKTIPYVINGCFVQRPDQMDLLNTRIQTRYQTDIPLAPSFDPRPVQTKYTRFGVLDEYKTTDTSIQPDEYKNWSQSPFNTTNNQPFVVPTLKGPPLAYFMNLDKETSLQRQGAYMFNSKNLDDDSVYQPSQQGDLYQNQNAQYSGKGGSGEYSPTESTPYLFDEYKFSTTRKAPESFSSSRNMIFNQLTHPRGR